MFLSQLHMKAIVFIFYPYSVAKCIIMYTIQSHQLFDPVLVR